MRTRALPLLAVIPLMLPGDLPPVSRAPCAIAIELQVRAPLRWGVFEWHVVHGRGRAHLGAIRRDLVLG